MRAITMIGSSNSPMPPACRGVATCPWAPFVQARIAAELGVLSPNASLGKASSPSESLSSHEIRKPDESAVAYSCNASDPVLPSTFVFEDQVRNCETDVRRDFPVGRPSCLSVLKLESTLCSTHHTGIRALAARRLFALQCWGELRR